MYDSIVKRFLEDGDFFIQALAATGQCSASLIGAIAAILAFITIRQMERQSNIQMQTAGLPELAFSIAYSDKKPNSGAPIIESGNVRVVERDATSQLSEVLGKWQRNPFKAKLADHNYLIVRLEFESTNGTATKAQNINAQLRITIPPSPNLRQHFAEEKYWQSFSLQLQLNEIDGDKDFYIPLTGVAACKVEAKGVFEFAKEKHDIIPHQGEFNDYHLAFGAEPTGADTSGSDSSSSTIVA